MQVKPITSNNLYKFSINKNSSSSSNTIQNKHAYFNQPSFGSVFGMDEITAKYSSLKPDILKEQLTKYELDKKAIFTMK